MFSVKLLTYFFVDLRCDTEIGHFDFSLRRKQNIGSCGIKRPLVHVQIGINMRRASRA